MRRIALLIATLAMAIMPVFAEENSASVAMSFTIPGYTKIQPISDPVLIANITDRTGNLRRVLSTKFKVITNTNEKQTLYLKANTTTDAGEESGMFEQGGRVYIAFSSVNKIPTSQSLANCKMGGMSNNSPGIVAYPILSVTAPNKRFNYDKYEIEIGNGTSYVSIDVGPNVLPSSFAANDPKGFYKTTISLTESDI